MSFGFYGPLCKITKEIFSCMSNGFPDTPVETEEYRVFNGNMKYVSRFGTYGELYDWAKSVGKQAKAAIVFTNNVGEENRFLKELSSILKCPIVGGGAAIGSDPEVTSIPDMSAQAGIYIITDENIEAEATFYNIHEEIIEECTLEFEGRLLKKINGIAAADYLKHKKAEYGLPENDFEHMTLSTYENINVHLNKNDGINIKSGRDLEEKMLLRYVAPEDVQARMESFIREEGAIVFGCAGLRGIMNHTFSCDNLVAFLFGEICSINGHSDFGNLMLSKLRVTQSGEKV